MNGIIATFVFVTLASAQFLLNHKGDFENTIQGYRFQFHDQYNLLLIVHSLDCYISEVSHGSPLETQLLNASTRVSTYQKMIPIIQAGKDMTKTELNQVHQKYGDYLLRALCFRSEIFNLDTSKIV